MIATLATLAALAVPAGALAAAGPPPGNAGADQYTENIPGAGGSNTTSGGAGGGGGSAIPAATANQLQAQGPAGQGAASFAEATGPRSTRHADSSGRPGGGAASGNPGSGGGSPLANVLKQVAGGSDSGDGMGPVLPIALGASLVAALALLLARRRGRSAGQA